MPHRAHRLFSIAAAIVIANFTAAHSSLTHAALPPDQSRPMQKQEPMAGEMKKHGMIKEDVSKAAKKWGERMDKKMKQEKMK